MSALIKQEWIHDQSNGSVGSIYTINGTPIAQVQMIGALAKQSKATVAERKALADFIAAAPELFEALESLLLEAVPVAAEIEGDQNVVRMSDDEWEGLVKSTEKARAAIAKAKGEKP